jgi:hypothetical protein
MRKFDLCNRLIHEKMNMCVLHMNPQASALKDIITIQKFSAPVTPVINIIHTISYKLAKHICLKLKVHKTKMQIHCHQFSKFCGGVS